MLPWRLFLMAGWRFETKSIEAVRCSSLRPLSGGLSLQGFEMESSTWRSHLSPSQPLSRATNARVSSGSMARLTRSAQISRYFATSPAASR